MLRRLFGSKDALTSQPTAEIDARPISWRPMTDSPADARRARPREWIAYLDARAACLDSLRRGDLNGAARYAEESRRLHAAWRGYEYTSSRFNIPMREERLDPQLVGLSDRVVVEQELAAHSFGLVDAPNQVKRLLGVTIADDLAWPWFDEWRHWFVERNSAPPAWEEQLLHPPPNPEEADERYRDQLRDLASDERIAISFGGHAMEIEFLAEDLYLTIQGTRALATDLAARGLAAYPATPAGRLARALTVTQLKSLAESMGVGVKGRKGAILDALVPHLDDAELDRLAPGDFVELTGPPATTWMGYRRAFIEIWAHTMTMLGFKRREIRDSTGMRDILNGYSIIGDDQCIFCRTKNKTTIALSDIVPEALPPYHPGCRCATAPWGQWE
jgi:hypothetical protein